MENHTRITLPFGFDGYIEIIGQNFPGEQPPYVIVVVTGNKTAYLDSKPLESPYEIINIALAVNTGLVFILKVKLEEDVGDPKKLLRSLRSKLEIISSKNETDSSDRVRGELHRRLQRPPS